MFSRKPTCSGDSLRVITYINIYLSFLWFSFHKDIYNHKDILLVSFLNGGSVYYMMKIYSDLFQMALKYLKDTKVNVQNILVITGDFNIWGSLWNPDYPFHLSHSNLLFDIMDSFNLSLSEPTNQVSTRYSDHNQDSNSVIDLMFLWFGSEELDSYLIQLEWYLTLDHTPLHWRILLNQETYDCQK